MLFFSDVRLKLLEKLTRLEQPVKSYIYIKESAILTKIDIVIGVLKEGLTEIAIHSAAELNIQYKLFNIHDVSRFRAITPNSYYIGFEMQNERGLKTEKEMRRRKKEIQTVFPYHGPCPITITLNH